MLTVEQVAEMFGVSGRTVRRRIASGELPSYRYGRMIRVRYKDVCELWAYRETLARPGRMVVS
jgi:excisionase family DNA binding protein